MTWDWYRLSLPPLPPGMAETQVQAQSPEHSEAGGEDEQPHSVGGHHHSLSEGEPLQLACSAALSAGSVCVLGSHTPHVWESERPYSVGE